MQSGPEIRGDYFIDRLGGITQVVLALSSLGIVLTRFKTHVLVSDQILAALFGLEIIGALAITRSKLPLMRLAFWIYACRVAAGFAYMSVVHGDKLATSTFGFPVVVAIYCWTRVRALKAKP